MADSVTTGFRKLFRKLRLFIHTLDSLNEQDNVNYFLVDNYKDEDNKGIIPKKTPKFLLYESCGYFNVTHENHIYKIGEFDRLKIENT